jgi:ssDNA-binding Zn-finger/Zn-ribbon topoisomerase 1
LQGFKKIPGKKELSMQETRQSNPDSHEVKQRFDAALAGHMKRLMEASEGIGDLPLNSVTLSCLVLLAEREHEIQGFPSDAPERYTRDTFIHDLADIGLNSAEDINAALEDITQRGYIDIGPDGRFIAGRPALSIAKFLDQALPGMPGMNLVAYLVQTTEEVLSGRKGLEAAINQFDQTLEMHGVGLSGQEAKPAVSPVRGKATQTPKGKGPSTQALRSALAETLRKRQAEKQVQPGPDRVGQPVVLTATGKASKVEVRELFPKRDKSAAAPPVSAEDEQLQEPERPKEEPAETHTEESLSPLAPLTEAQGLHDEADRSMGQTADTFSEHDSNEEDLSKAVPPTDGEWEEVVSEQETPPSLSEDVEKEQAPSTEAGLEDHHTRSDQPEGAPQATQTEEETGIVSATHDRDVGDEMIESRITAFEEGLATACPLCAIGRIERKETAKSKSYYVCSNKDCVFISWGKPYHMACPHCKNPFLIESTDKAGEAILRCPRATCRYRQKPPGERSDNPLEPSLSTPKKPLKPRARSRKPKRRVVRKRLVRRKH